MTKPALAFIGAGNMAAALIHGLVEDGYPPDRITAADADLAKLDVLGQRYGIRTSSDNTRAVADADVIVMAVKPQVVREVARDLAPAISGRKPLVGSIAAGVPSATLQDWLGGGVPVVRTMPNTPAMVQTGATALFASPQASEEQRSHAESLMRAVGLTLWLDDEKKMDAVTALSGSGPAYFFLVMEAMTNAARDLGLEDDTARLLTLQTALGAARMAMESEDDPATLRARVTSPGGTTEQAIGVLEAGDIHGLFRRALAAACKRSVELSGNLGDR